MMVEQVRLSGPLIITPQLIRDERGFFLETFRRDRYRDLGVDADFVQNNHSRSVRGAVRALHFQLSPGQPKLVRVARGAVFDVIVDLRRSSPSFGQWESFVLDDVTHHQLYVPAGFAHGFCVVSDVADVVYLVGSYYDPATERGLAWDDPDLAIPWPTKHPILSDRDRRNPKLPELIDELPDW